MFLPRSLRSFAVVPAMALAVVTASTESFATHSWGNYHWARTSNPFTLKLGDNLSGTWDGDGYLVIASADWNKANALNTLVVLGQANPKNCRPTSGMVQVCNSTYGSNGWLGIAQIWVSGAHITKGAVKLNDTYFNNATYNFPAWRQFVMCQEVGHTFGLDHQDEAFDNGNLLTCMDYTNKPETNQHPDLHDYDQLALIYGHNDGTTTVSSAVAPSGNAANETSPGMADIVLDTPREWGRLVRSSHRGRTEVYERDLGGGQKVFTFVTWAIDEPGHRRPR